MMRVAFPLTAIPGIRPLWRRLLAWRFHLFQRHRHRQLILETVGGRPFVVLPEVFNPKLFRTGEWMAAALGPALFHPGSRVLDMGTGTGVGAITAAQWAERVVAVDINPEAVRCARLNALLNRVEGRVEVRQGDLFEPVGGERWDLVLFNPPYYPGEPRDRWDHSWRSDTVQARFVAGLPGALAPGGRALVVLSSDADPAAWQAAFEAQGLQVTPFRQQDYINETLILLQVEAL